MNSLRPILLKLDRPGSHIIYNTFTKRAFLCDGHPQTDNSQVGSIVPTEDLLSLFEKAWITRYDSHDGEHKYRLTETGRRASSKIS